MELTPDEYATAVASLRRAAGRLSAAVTPLRERQQQGLRARTEGRVRPLSLSGRVAGEGQDAGVSSSHATHSASASRQKAAV